MPSDIMAGLMLVYRQQKLKRHKLDVVDSGVAQSLRLVLFVSAIEMCVVRICLKLKSAISHKVKGG